MVLAITAYGEMSTTAQTIASKVRVDTRSGRLVRSRQVIPRLLSPHVVEPSTVSPSAVRSKYRSAGVRDLLQNTARKHEVEPELVESVIKVESNFNPHAISNKGAEGLMQLIPSTARRFGVQNTFDPAQNIEGGVRYLKYLLEMFKGDERLALAAYNAGEGAVVKHKGIPPYPETRNYVYQVGKHLGQARRASVATAKPAPQQREFSEIVKSVDAEGREFYRAN